MLNPDDPGGGGQRITYSKNNEEIKENNSNNLLSRDEGVDMTDNSLLGKKKDEKRLNNLLYRCQDPGPYIVYVESTEKSGNNVGRFNDLKIAKEICKLNIEEVKKIKNKGQNRISIEFKDYVNANKLVRNNELFNKGYNIYIPLNLTTCKGIVRGVHKSILISEVLEAYEAPVKILHISRLNRKIVDKDSKEPQYEPTNTLLITFEGVHLPRAIQLYKIEKDVIPYVAPVTQCFRCLRFGHTKRICKGKERCFNCGNAENHEITTENNNDNQTKKYSCHIKCFYCCSEEHRTNNKICPEQIRQKEIKRIMAFENLSYFDANELCPKKYAQNDNSFISHPAEFPPLTKNNRYLQDKNINDKIAPRERRTIEFNSSPKRSFQQVTNDPIKNKKFVVEGYDKSLHNQQLIAPTGRSPSVERDSINEVTVEPRRYHEDRSIPSTSCAKMPFSAPNPFSIKNFNAFYNNLTYKEKLEIEKIILQNKNFSSSPKNIL